MNSWEQRRFPFPKKEDKPKANKPPKVNNENAAPVPGKPNPKAHNETMKGKGKDGQGKERGKRENRRGRSPSQDRKSFIRVDALRVKIVLSVIQRRKPPRGSSTEPGNGEGGNPRNDRTPSPKPKSEKPSFLYAKGKCDRADCPYRHDNDAAPAEAGSAKAKATPKGKAKAKSAAVVVEVNRKNNDGYLSDWSDDDGPSPFGAGKVMKKRLGSHVRKDKIVKIKRNPEKIHIDVGFDTRGLPKGNRTSKSEPRCVRKEFLHSATFKRQTMLDQLIARARAKVLNNDINGRKPEVKVMIGKGVYINVRWKGKEILEDMVVE